MARIEFTLGAPDSPVLEAFMADRGRVSFIMGPLGSGKTYGAIQRILAQMTEQLPNAEGVRPSRWIVVRNTYPDLMGTTVKDFREIFTEPHFGKFKQGSMEPPTFHANFLIEDGSRVISEVVFMALDRDDHVKKLRGVQATGAWFNEIKEIPKAIVDMADARIGRYPSIAAGGVVCTWHGMIGDTNAPDDEHWYAVSAEIRKPKGWTFFRQPGGVFKTDQVDHLGQPVFRVNQKAENINNLPLNYYSNIIINKETDWIIVNVQNEYGFYVEGKPVHPNYVDSVHCPGVIPYNKELPIAIGVDFGRTPAAAIIQVDPLTGRKSVIDEFCTRDQSAALFAPELFRFLREEFPDVKISSVWGDPAGDKKGEANEDTPMMIMQAAGIAVQPCETNAIIARRAAIANPLGMNCMDGRPRLLISAKAKMIRKGLMGGFCYKKLMVQGVRFGELPDKNQYSHPVEALEYVLMGVGEYHLALKSKTVKPRGGAASYLARTE